MSEKKIEAIKRMKLLRLYEKAISEFAEEEIVNKSIRGGLYYLTDEERNMVNKFEKENDALVYHVILSNTNLGIMYSLLYVSKHKDEWELDIEDIKYGTVLAYVKNITCEDCSEFGTIGIKSIGGGLLRIS